MMEHVTDSNAAQETAGMPAVSLGAMLKEARERLGLSVMDVSSQIKFAPRQIEALEADDYRHLPETAFLRGFVRSYAKILHLDAQELLAALPQKKPVEAELTPDSVEEPFPGIHSVLRHNLIWSGAALLVLMMVAGFALWHFSTPPEPVETEQVESPVSLPAEAPLDVAQPVPEAGVIKPESAKMPLAKMPLPNVQFPATLAQSPVQAANEAFPRLTKGKQAIAAAVPPGAPPDTPPGVQPGAQPETPLGAQPDIQRGVQPDPQPDIQPDTSTPVTSLRMEFTEEAWAEIKDRNGKILSSRTHPAGSEMTVNGRAPFSLLVGHALAVRVYYRDRQIDLVPHTRRSTEVAHLTLE